MNGHIKKISSNSFVHKTCGDVKCRLSECYEVIERLVLPVIYKESMYMSNKS